jgi:hypothetical protein
MSEFYGAENEEEFAENMNVVAYGVDTIFNASQQHRPQDWLRDAGVSVRRPRGPVRYISNGANRQEVVAIMKRQIKRLEGQPEITGWVLDRGRLDG